MISFLEFLNEKWYVVNIKTRKIDSEHGMKQAPAHQRAKELNSGTFEKYGENHYYVTADHGHEGMSAKELKPKVKKQPLPKANETKPKSPVKKSQKEPSVWDLIKKSLK